eukprot:6214219-Pleurochrysis_carterae.AAC.4
MFPLPVPPGPLPLLGPAPPLPRPLPPCLHACSLSFLSSSNARSLSITRVSCLRRLHGKNLHLGRMKRQIPRCVLNSLQTVCVRTELSAVLSSSRAPSVPFATSSQISSSLSSCACGQQVCMSSFSTLLRTRRAHDCVCERVSRLLLLLHAESVLRARRLLLCPSWRRSPSGLCHQLLCALRLLHAIFP